MSGSESGLLLLDCREWGGGQGGTGAPGSRRLRNSTDPTAVDGSIGLHAQGTRVAVVDGAQRGGLLQGGVQLR